MIQEKSSSWQEFLKHVLKWEGKTSKDPRDVTAAKCSPFPGAYHTNKGVTYCTFKSMAPKLGITPVTYDRFIKMTDREIGLFVYDFYKASKPELLPDSISLSLTEARWMSGVHSVKHLQKILNLPQTGSLDSKTIAAANGSDEKDLFNAYWKERDRFLKSLSVSKTYYGGWKNRMLSFFNLSFLPGAQTPEKKKFLDAFDPDSWAGLRIKWR